MTHLFIYYLKASVALTLFYLFYRLMFDRDTFFSWKRALLIGSISLSVIYPFINITTLLQSNEPVKRVATYYVNTLPEFVVNASPQTNWWNVPDLASAVWLIYLVGTITFAIKMLTQLGSILILRKKGNVSFINGVKIISLNKEIAPFSFFNWIFVNPDQHSPHELKEILIHEQTHAREWHSLDVLFCQLAGVAFWFNPFVWLIQSTVRQNLEYLADHRVIRSGYDSKGYQYHLLRLTNNLAAANLGNNFNVSELKKRIIMMNTKKSSSLSLTKYVLVIPLATVLLITNHAEALAKKVEKMTPVANLIQAVNPQTELREQPLSLIKPEKASTNEVTLASVKDAPQSTTTEQQKDKNNATQLQFNADLQVEPYVVVEQMPEYPGGTDAMMRFLAQNIKYPVDAQQRGVQGMVVLSFIITKSGEINTVKVERSVDPALDKEAIRVVSLMPNWIPGKQSGKNVNVKFTLPVRFALDKPSPDKALTVIGYGKSEASNKIDLSGVNSPLVIIDGKESSKDQITKIDPTKIKQISVLKDESATKVYGDKGKNGVIIVELKKE